MYICIDENKTKKKGVNDKVLTSMTLCFPPSNIFIFVLVGFGKATPHPPPSLVFVRGGGSGRGLTRFMKKIHLLGWKRNKASN